MVPLFGLFGLCTDLLPTFRFVGLRTNFLVGLGTVPTFRLVGLSANFLVSRKLENFGWWLIVGFGNGGRFGLGPVGISGVGGIFSSAVDCRVWARGPDWCFLPIICVGGTGGRFGLGADFLVGRISLVWARSVWDPWQVWAQSALTFC